MTEFIYNNSKNSSIGYILFKFNSGYHFHVFFKEDTNPQSRFCSADMLDQELENLILIYCQNILHAQKFQKYINDKSVKPRSYALGEKNQLNSKYIKIKHNLKLQTKFFHLFKVLHQVGKQAYKLEFQVKEKIHDVIHILLLKQNITKKSK